jgi:peptide/nickel transport system substrate-binding protein
MFAKFLQSAAAALLAAPALAAPDSITLAMVLEPPNLDPTGGAAAAIDEVVYANLFEGLTRIGPDGSVQPGLAASWDVAGTARPIPSTCNRA